MALVLSSWSHGSSQAQGSGGGAGGGGSVEWPHGGLRRRRARRLLLHIGLKYDKAYWCIHVRCVVARVSEKGTL